MFFHLFLQAHIVVLTLEVLGLRWDSLMLVAKRFHSYQSHSIQMGAQYV